MGNWYYDWSNGHWVQDTGNDQRGQGQPHYSYGFNLGQGQQGQYPYYAQDAQSILGTLGFPGVAAQLTYGSGVLEPQRQAAYDQMLGYLTPAGAEARAQGQQKGAYQAATAGSDQLKANVYGG